MSIMDKITGRTKKAAGDLTGDSSLRRQGAREERKGEAKDQLDRAQDAVQDKAEEVARPRAQDLTPRSRRGTLGGTNPQSPRRDDRTVCSRI